MKEARKLVNKSFALLLSFLLVFSLAMPAVGAVENIDISDETSIQIENESEIEESEQEVNEGEGDEQEEPEEPSASDATEEESDENEGPVIEEEKLEEQIEKNESTEQKAPQINILNYESSEVVFQSAVSLEIEALDGNKETLIPTVELGGEAIKPSESGTYNVSLAEGMNVFDISAEDELGQKTSERLILSYSKVKVVEFVPAPGQFTNTSYTTDAEKKVRSKGGNLISLGGFGGYVIVEFEKPVKNDPRNPYGIDFTVFGNPFETNGVYNQEPGAVEVAVSKDGPWYHLAGSEYDNEDTYTDYEVTYWNPESHSEKAGQWHDNKGNEGVVSKGQYPQKEDFPNINEDRYTLGGVSIFNDVPRSDIGTSRKQVQFGYADSTPKLNDNYEIPNNPYTTPLQGAGGDAMDISWAVDKDGNRVHLDEIKFVKIYTAVNKRVGALGEVSTEINGMGASKLIEQQAATLEIKNEENTTELPIGEQLQLYADGFDEAGEPVIVSEVNWTSSDESIATIDPITGIVTALDDGEVTITGYLKVDKSVKAEFVLTAGEKAVPTEMQVITTTGNYSIAESSNVTLTAIVLDQYGKTMGTDGLIWKATDNEIVSINPFLSRDYQRLIKGEKEGITEISVEYEGLQASAIVKVLDKELTVRADNNKTPTATRIVSHSNITKTIAQAVQKNKDTIYLTVINTDDQRTGDVIKLPLKSLEATEKAATFLKMEAKDNALRFPASFMDLKGFKEVDKHTLFITSELSELTEAPKGLRPVGKTIQYKLELAKDNVPIEEIKEFPKGQSSTVTLKFLEHELKDVDTDSLTGYYFDPELEEWKSLGGEYNSAERSFSFSAFHPGKFAVFEESDEADPKTIPVHVRIEGLGKTIVPLTKLDLVPFDLNDTVGENSIGSDEPFAVHAVIKALELQGYDVTDRDLFDFGGGEFIRKIAGLEMNSTNPQKDGWSYYVNNEFATEGIGSYRLQENDSITLYFGTDYTRDTFTWFDKTNVSAGTNEEVEISLIGSYYDGDTIQLAPVENAVILLNDKPLTIDGKEVVTDKNGITKLRFDEIGDYHLSAERIDGEYSNIIRPYSKITIQEDSGETPEEKDITVQLSIDGRNGSILKSEDVKVTDQQTALDALKKTLDNATPSINYVIEESSWGAYISSINGEAAGSLGGWDGWMYTVNGEAPEVGADVYELEEGDQLRFYYSRWAAISSQTKIESGTENPKAVIKLVGDTFSKDATSSSSWKIDTGTTGLKVKSIKKVENQEATVEFNGKAKTGSLSIQALKAALDGKEPSEAISIKVTATDDLLTDTINDTVGYYKATGSQLSGWTNLVALWGTGEDILDGTWELPSWESADPGLEPNDGDTAHIRYIFGLLAMDKNPTNAWETNRNLYAELAAQQTEKGNIGSVNKHMWAMLVLDTGERMGHDVGTWNEETKQQALDYLLTQEKNDGGFAYFGSVADIDMTGMGLLALANYQGNSAADAAIERAKGILKAKHLDKTGLGLSESSNSLATAITGLVAVGEDLLLDEWIVNGQSVVDQLKSYQLEDGSFKYLSNQTVGNGMATVQSLIALQDIQAGKTVWERLSERELSEQDPIDVQVTEEEYTLEEKLQDNFFTPVILQFQSKALPKVTAMRGSTTLEIPAGTNIKSEDWDEKLQVPTTRNTNVSGLREKINAQLKDKEVERVDLRIKVGGNKRIDFDNHVTLKLKGQSGKDAGFIDADGTFEAIKKYPNADLRDVGVYAYDSGDDLIIKTKHFTEFLAFKATLIEVEEPGTGGGGNGGGSTSPTTKTVTVSVEKRSIGEGDIIPSTDVSLETGDTAYDVLKRVANQKGISINASGSGAGLYVKAIDGLAEFDHGARSGWMYSVNGTFPSSSAGSYTLKDGDVLRWQYTTTLGEEIGGGGGGAAPSPGPTPENPEKPENQPTAMEPLIDDAAKWMQNNRDFSAYDEFADWDVLALARAEKEVPKGYYEVIEKHVNNNKGEFRLVTDYERIALTTTALGKDARNIGGYDFIEKIYNNERMTNQGTNGALFALLALDAQDAEVPANAVWTRDRLLAWLIDQQNDDGGFPLSKEAGSASDLDITAMVLQALAKYQDRKDVKEVTEKALLWISEQQLANGGFIVWDEENSESVSQVIIGLTSLGISLDDERFVKKDGYLLTALHSFINKDGGIAHTRGEASNYMATQQGLLALAANDRLLKKKNRIYDMTDVTLGEIPKEELTFSDLDKKHFAYKEIMEMVDAGIISGYRDGTFRPDDRLIRGQAAILFARALNLESPANPQGFKELPKSNTFYEAAHATKAAGVFAGKKDGTFGAQDELTREQMASVLVRAFDLKGTGEKVPLKDLDKVSKLHRKDVEILYQNGITAGRSNGTFDPRSSVSRAQFSAFLYRALEK